jgi:tRNA(adenine34) deaminase
METPLKSHEQWINHAQKLAEKALPKDVPVGAVILSDEEKILAEAFNQREVFSDPTAHAEIIALRKAGKMLSNWRLENCTLYVTLEPCPMCASAIIQARVGHVVFGAYDALQGALGSALDLKTLYASKMSVTGGILEEQCQKQLHDFFNARR